MKTVIEDLIKNFVRKYPEKLNTVCKWGEPLIAYAAADNKEFYALKKVVGSTHALPEDLLPDAKTVVVYFIPFDQVIIESNVDGRHCSKEWGIAYIETNQLIADLNAYIRDELEKLGYESNIIPATHNFDVERLVSDWSHRHVAVIAGLGTFGLNNMLITDKGCCGRIGSFVTDVKLTPSEKSEKENCLYKKLGTCKKCVDRCVNDALKVDDFNRYKCYEMCLDNDRFHSKLGLVDVCGKCLVNIPCSTKIPLKL